MSRISIFSGLLIGAGIGVVAGPAYAMDITVQAHQVPLFKASQKILRQRLAEPVKAQQIGTAIALGKSLSDGTWTVDNGHATWQLALGSDGAQAIALALTGVVLPSGATLTWATTSGLVTQGPYTSADIPASGAFYTPMVPGATGVLTLVLAGSDTAGTALTVRDIQHIYAMMPATEGDGVVRPKATDTAGACNVDVVCPAGDAWRNEIRATVRYTIVDNAAQNVYACSAALINNTNNSEDPLLYTANHCTSGNNVSSVVAYYNFQKAACNGPAMSASGWSQTQTGSTLITSGTSSDYALLRMTSSVPSAYNAYFNAWNASTASTASSGADIHHPSADVKKISLYTTAATRTTVPFTVNNATNNDQVWGVNWSTGTTEEGSSGSNLLNQDHQVIGALSGGNGACSTTTPTQNNGMTDYFGRLDVAYAESAAMRAALDPATAGKALSACGKSQGVAGCASSTTTTTGGTGTTTTGSTATTAIANSSSGGGGGGAFGEGLLAGLAAIAVRARRRRWVNTSVLSA